MVRTNKEIEVISMTIKDIANDILSPIVKPYVKYDTLTAKQHYFMCIFSESFDFGINILNANIDTVIGQLKQSSNYVIDKMKVMIADEIDGYEEIYLIYYLLYHEEGHWLEFLESGMDSKTYCKNIDLSGYKGALIDIGHKIKKETLNKQHLLDEYDWLYRSNPYEQRADVYALKKLKTLLKISEGHKLSE